MKLNKAQREGLARVSGMLATSAIIGSAVGLTGYITLDATQIVALAAGAVLFLVLSLLLRRDAHE